MLAFTAAGVTTGARVGDARASPPGDAAIALDGTGLYAASVPRQRAIYCASIGGATSVPGVGGSPDMPQERLDPTLQY